MLKIKLLNRGIGGFTKMMLGICHREVETRQTLSVMMVAFFALFSQIGAMVLLISLERIRLENCTSAQIEALEEGNR